MGGRRNAVPFFMAFFFIALVVVGAGYVVGRSTYLAAYRSVANGQVQTYISGTKANGNTDYFQLKGDTSVYRVTDAQMKPTFSAKSLSKTSHVTLTVMPDPAGTVDLKPRRGVQVKGPVYAVLAVAVTTGKRTTNYATQQYLSSPQGYQHTQEELGSRVTTVGVAALALFLAALVLFLFSIAAAAAAHVMDLDFRIPSPLEVATSLLTGVFFLAVNFPVVFTNVGEAISVPAVRDLGTTSRADLFGVMSIALNVRAVSFDALWSKFLIGLAVYLGMLALLSLRHLRLDLFALGAIFLAVGAASLHLAAWAVAILIALTIVLWHVLGWLGHILVIVIGWLAHVIGAIAGFLGHVLGALWALIFKLGWWTPIIALVVIGAIFLAIKYHEEFFELLAALLPIWIFALAIGAFILLVKLFQLLEPLLAPILAFLGRVLAFLGVVLALVLALLIYVFVGLFVGWIIYGFGALLLDEFKGAWTSGNGRRGVILGSLAIGISVALILMETNLYGVVAYYPGAFATFATTYLQQGSPLVDLLIAILVLGVSILGLLRNLRELLTEPDIEGFRTALVMAGFGVVVVIVGGALYSYYRAYTGS